MSGYKCSGDDGYPIVELDSDEDQDCSSEDEVNVFLHGTPEAKRRLRRQSLGQELSSEDEFEKEMAAELNETMSTLEKDTKTASKTNNRNNVDGSKPELYDNVYFDSDSDEENTRQEKSEKKHEIPSNDELLYDPAIDDDNQKWVDQRRQQYQPGPSKKLTASVPKPGKDKRPKPLPHSDAVLNCPACMTLICLDCQRHDKYKNQYRAMFVLNCGIAEGDCLKIPEQPALGKKQLKKQQRKQRRQKVNVTDVDNMETDPELVNTVTDTSETMEMSCDEFHPVRCNVCTTELGVYDSEEIYHFFNVLASHS